MPLTIRRIEAVIVPHALRPERVVMSAAGCHDESTFLTVTIEDGEGRRGYGEAATVMVWSGESAATAKWIVEKVFARRLLGASFDHPREALELLDKAAVGNPFTKSAIDTALWDLWAKRRNVPAWTLFADREPAPAIPIRGSIGAYPLARTVSLAREFWEAGVRTLKFKVGLPGGEDRRRLAAVREALGDGPIFTVDYNGAFADADEACAHIASLGGLAVAMVEQPTHRDRIGLMAEVRRRIDVPVLADEAVFSRQHLEEAIDLDAFDLVALYPGKNGGFSRSLEMAALASAAGKSCVIGSNLETDLGQAAMASLAAALSAFPVSQHACDILSALYYRESSVTRPITLREGSIVPPDGPGFGVTPRAAAALCAA